LAEVLKNIPEENSPDLLIGYNKADDAGVFRINERQALVQTVDFFPPIVDDPYVFGQIAAANALSDIYAMGGKPLTALNIVGFPSGMAPSVLTQILKGGADKIHEAGATIVGGHSIKDKELKYGLACTGIIDIEKIISNTGAEAGDYLLLTKPLGTGIIATAIKQKIATAEDTANVSRQMAELNRAASELMVRYGAHAATDITGFGLLGHAFEMAEASGVSMEMEFGNLPLLPNVIKYAEAGALTGGANANREYLQDMINISDKLSKAQTDILFDAQTSGGLLIALDDNSCHKLLSDKEAGPLRIVKIGRITEKKKAVITIA